jgi:hypothetical protein
MTQFEEQDLPDDLREVAERLRAERPTFTNSELDQLKLRTMTKSSSSPGRTIGTRMRSRLLTLALTGLLVGGTTAGAIAAGGAGGSSNAASAQYKPGNGCGTTGHTGPPPKNGKTCP